MTSDDTADRQEPETPRADSTSADAPGTDSRPPELEAELPRDTLFDLLSSARRRYVVRHLLQHGGEAEFAALVDHVAALEVDTSTGELTADERKPVYVSLRQTHLPRLDEAGVVEYDQHRGTVSATGRLAALVPPLRAVDEAAVATDDPPLPLPEGGATVSAGEGGRCWTAEGTD